MARSFVLSNSTILVGLDEHARVRDFFFPYVGMENHTCGVPHRLGIWVDGSFSWLDEPIWQKKLVYKKETLVSEVTMVHKQWAIEVHFNDCVDRKKNLFFRLVTVRNIGTIKRSIRSFFHQSFTIFDSPYGDTVYYNPLIQALIHYKSKRYFLINGCLKGEKVSGISSYACGLAGQYGRVSTALDAEDGQLSGNPIEHGVVDSVIAFNYELEPKGEQTICYWIAAGTDTNEVAALNTFAFEHQAELTLATEAYWKKWVNQTPFDFHGLSEGVIDLFKRSLLIVRAHADHKGAIIASSDSEASYTDRDTYSYMWPRDGALVAFALDRAGYIDLTQKFFSFCAQVLTPQGYLFHKYLPNRSLGSSWHSWIYEGQVQLPIQEDETATVLHALWRHYLLHGNRDFIKSIFTDFIAKAGDFILNYMDPALGLPKPSYDIWEEKLGIHTYTASAIYAGLRAMAHFESLFGSQSRVDVYTKTATILKDAILKHFYNTEHTYFIKGVYYKENELHYDLTNDLSSMYGIIEYGVLDEKDPRVTQSFQSVMSNLKVTTPIGGFARYKDDHYYERDSQLPGNPWFITTLWVANYLIQKAQREEDFREVKEIFEWVTKHALSTGILSEQLDPYTGYQLSVAPLTWSHAAYVTSITKYLEKLDALGICKICNPVIETV